MGKRYIRLKEFSPLTEKFHTPSPEQVECSDESLVVAAYRCRVDGNGFIVTGNDNRTGLESIVFMGDSFVESMYAKETERFVSVIERDLVVEGRRFNALNAGYSGSTSLQILNSLVNKVYPVVGPGSTIVLVVPQSDRDSLYKPGSFWNVSPRGATLLPPGGVGNEALPQGNAALRPVLDLIVAACRSLGLKLVLVSAPYKVADFSFDAPLRRIYRRNREAYNLGLARRNELSRVVAEVAQKNSINYFDGHQALGGKSEFFYDELHLNFSGQTVFAESLTEALARII